MFWTTGLVLVALTFGQVPAGLVKPGFFIENGITKASTVSERIIGGWVASPGQFPYIVALRLTNAAGNVRQCAGSVVHRSWVLTTAHCTFNRISAVVRAGVTDLTTTIPEYISETAEWWIHPAYPGAGLSPNDISIMKLQQLLTYSKLVQPVRIQPSAEAFADYSNEMVIASGWGRRSPTGGDSNVLNWVYLQAISNRECRTTPVDDNFICTRGYNDTSQSTCFDDNGGPLVHPGRDGEPVLVGIAAFWRTSGCNSLPAGFIRPGPFHDWLTEVTEINFENLNEGIEVTETPELLTTENTETISTEGTEPPTTEPPKPPTTEASEPSSTLVPKPPTTEAPNPPTTEETEATTTESTKPPTSESPKPSTSEAPEPPTIIIPKPPTTEAPNALTTEETEAPTTESTKPPTSEPPKPPTTEAPEPTTTIVPKPPSTEAPKPPTTEEPEPSSEEYDDPAASKLVNKLHVNKVKVIVNNNVNNFK